MTRCIFSDGSFDIPEGLIERTVIILAPEHANPEQPSLNITYDYLLPPKTLDGYVKAQLTLMSEKLKGFQLSTQEESLLGQQVNGYELSSHYLREKQTIYQRQAVYPLSEKKLIIFTLAFNQPLTETHLQQLKRCLDSFTFNAM